MLALSSAEATVSSQVTGKLSGAGILGVLPTAAAADLKDVVGLSLAVVQGRLQNSAMLSKLDECFLHLTESQCEDVVQLIKSNVSLFSDVPT